MMRPEGVLPGRQSQRAEEAKAKVGQQASRSYTVYGI